MKPSVSVICQVDGHVVADEYAALIASLGFPVVVNFPSTKGYTRAESPGAIASTLTAMVILIVSVAWFRRTSHAPAFHVDPEVVQKIFSLSSGHGNIRIFPVIIDDESQALVPSIWIGKLQWFRDSVETRNQLLSYVSQLDNISAFDESLTHFEGVMSTIKSIETASDVTVAEQVKVRQSNIAYDVYECRHRIHGTTTVYVHLYRGISISATAEHYKGNFKSRNLNATEFIVMNHERGQVQLNDRKENVKRAFSNDKVSYIEDLISIQLKNILGDIEIEGPKQVDRAFLEPQIRSANLSGTNAAGSDFEKLMSWLAAETAGVIVLEGQGGIGKTWTMNECRARVLSGSIKFDRAMERRVIFITSTDVNRPGSYLNDVRTYMTLYDLFVASERARMDKMDSTELLHRDTFYNALELGNIIVMVDGLDEIIARHRPKFDPDFFFSDLQARMTGVSNVKVIISCRKIFFDQFEFNTSFPSVQTYELLAFDERLRDEYFQRSLSGLHSKIAKAYSLSDQIARLADGRFVPFVLSLIVDMMKEEADNGVLSDFKDFSSEQLDTLDYNDRIVGQFCEREIRKVGDPLRSLTVDQQLAVLCEMARRIEDTKGRPDAGLLRIIIAEVTLLRSVDEILDTFLSHPFVETARSGKYTLVSLRFDFMSSYFLMQGIKRRLLGLDELDGVDIGILRKYCTPGTFFCVELAKRLGSDDDDFGLRLVELRESGENIIERTMPPGENNILSLDSAATEFSWAVFSLMCAYLQHRSRFDAETLTSWIRSLYSESGHISRLALLAGFGGDGWGVRLDFRGVKLSECLFQSVNIWDFHYDSVTEFQRCRFVNCVGVRRRDSDISVSTFHSSCIKDDVFESVFSAGQEKVEDAQERIKRDIISFVADFYSSGQFSEWSEEYIKKHYLMANPVVPYKKIFAAAKDTGLLVRNEKKKDRIRFMIAIGDRPAVERLVTQGVISGKLKEIAIALR